MEQLAARFAAQTEEVRQAVEEGFAPEHRAAVHAQFRSMRMGDFGYCPLAPLQLALVDLSGGDPGFIVTGEYRKADWRDLLHAHQRLTKQRQLHALDVPSLVGMLDETATRVDALLGLTEKGSQAAPAVPRLLRLLRDREQLVVAMVLRTLGAIGPGSHEATPILLDLARREDYLIRFYARAALEAISPAAAARVDAFPGEDVGHGQSRS